MANVHSTKRGSRFIDLTGQQFGKWTVLHEAATRGKKVYWVCQCVCGTVSEVATGALRGERSKCCTRCRVKTHGLSTTPEYSVWCGMKARCGCPTNEAYGNYGGRGITVCSEWASFDAFYKDMGPRPSSHHTLERVDNSRGYDKDNCVWATRGVQLRNTRRTRRITFDGKTQCLSDWARDIGINYKTLENRIARGWTIEDALNPTIITPNYSRQAKRITFRGQTLSVNEWARHIGIHPSSLRERLARSWSIDEALTIPKRSVRHTSP